MKFSDEQFDNDDIKVIDGTCYNRTVKLPYHETDWTWISQYPMYSEISQERHLSYHYPMDFRKMCGNTKYAPLVAFYRDRVLDLYHDLKRYCDEEEHYLKQVNHQYHLRNWTIRIQKRADRLTTTFETIMHKKHEAILRRERMLKKKSLYEDQRPKTPPMEAEPDAAMMNKYWDHFDRFNRRMLFPVKTPTYIYPVDDDDPIVD